MFLWMFLLITITTLLFVLDKRSKRHFKDLPGPGMVPFLGNAHQCLGSSTDFFQVIIWVWYEFGCRVRVYIGNKLLLLLADPKDVEAVLTNHNELLEKSEEYNFIRPWLGNGLLTSSGEKWRAHRKMITPAFHFKILENFMEVFSSQTDILIEILRKQADGKQPISLYPIMGRYALDIIMETAMGVSMNAQGNENSEYTQAVRDMCAIMNKRSKNPLMRNDFYFKLTSDYRKQQRALKFLHGFTERMIAERRRILEEKKETLESYMKDDDGFGGKKKMAFLDLMLLSTINGQPISDRDLREEVDTFTFEGHDTTMSALSFALNQISKNPEVQRKLLEEQLMLFGDSKRNCTYSDLQDMKYLEMVIKEVVRLFPTAPLIAREATCDTHINDLFVPKGTSIVIMVYSMHRDPKLFPDPEHFIPERFSREESSKRSPFAAVPFSAGPRNCIGQKFAMIELKNSLSKIVREFEILPVAMDMELVNDVILKSVNGLYVKLIERDQSKN